MSDHRQGISERYWGSTWYWRSGQGRFRGRRDVLAAFGRWEIESTKSTDNLFVVAPPKVISGCHSRFDLIMSEAGIIVASTKQVLEGEKKNERHWLVMMVSSLFRLAYTNWRLLKSCWIFDTRYSVKVQTKSPEHVGWLMSSPCRCWFNSIGKFIFFDWDLPLEMYNHPRSAQLISEDTAQQQMTGGSIEGFGVCTLYVLWRFVEYCAAVIYYRLVVFVNYLILFPPSPESSLLPCI